MKRVPKWTSEDFTFFAEFVGEVMPLVNVKDRHVVLGLAVKRLVETNPRFSERLFRAKVYEVLDSHTRRVEVCDG